MFCVEFGKRVTPKTERCKTATRDLELSISGAKNGCNVSPVSVKTKYLTKKDWRMRHGLTLRLCLLCAI